MILINVVPFMKKKKKRILSVKASGMNKKRKEPCENIIKPMNENSNCDVCGILGFTFENFTSWSKNI